MPIYEYKCLQCGFITEQIMKTGDPQPACGKCGAGALERVYTSSFSVASSTREAAASSGTCCGSSTPCASPKHCCGK
ncbi:MAG: zinc ribbon domain-containing protein [Candidatus Eremiobacteraeota bacterium]|nr:zinc ribbon domain-containing protein [Candidatus Eremiobacteraeota bacterium]